MAVNDFIDFRINDFACISPEDWLWFRVEDNQRRFRRSPHVFVQPPDVSHQISSHVRQVVRP
jgi:hypothetical protein